MRDPTFIRAVGAWLVSWASDGLSRLAMLIARSIARAKAREGERPAARPRAGPR